MKKNKCYRCDEIATHKTAKGQYVCNKNSAKCSVVKSKLSSKLKEQYKNKTRVSHFKEFNDGSVWQGKYHSDETKNYISKLNKGKVMSDEFKNNRSVEMYKRYESGWVSNAGRCKKIPYSSSIAGDVLVDGTWELGVCVYLDEKNITWKRNTKRFKYINLDDKVSNYTPDFYLIDSDTYIEVKGYETDLDRCKWKQFTEKLEIWKRDKLLELNII
jgi:hypothetical protein